MEPLATPRVLIASSSDWEGLSRTPYLYAQAGWEVEVFVSANSFLAHSTYVGKLHAEEAEPPEFAEKLGAFVQEHGSSYNKIIVGDDPLLWELAKRRDQDWARTLLPCAGQDDEINFIISKVAFMRTCEARGIPVPQSIVCHTSDEVRAAALVIGFPLVLKQDQGYAGEGVRIVHTMGELDRFTPVGEVLIQRFVVGQICSAAVLYKRGKLVAFFSYMRSRTWGDLGASTAVKFRVFPELQKILEDLGEISHFDGQCGIDFMLEQATSKVLILEQNFRPTLTMLLGKRVGADFSDALRTWDAPSSVPLTQDPSVRSEVPFFPSDIARAISDRDLPVLLRWLVDPSWMREMNWHDRKLLRHNVGYLVRFVRKKFSRFFTHIWKVLFSFHW